MKCLIPFVIVFLFRTGISQNLSIGLQGGSMYSNTYWNKTNSFYPMFQSNLNFNFKLLVSDLYFNYIDFKNQGNLYELSSSVGLGTPNNKTIFFDIRVGVLIIRSSDLPYQYTQQNTFPIFYNQIQPVLKSNLNYKLGKTIPLFIKLSFEYNLLEFLLDEKHVNRLNCLKFTLGLNYLIFKAKDKKQTINP